MNVLTEEELLDMVNEVIARTRDGALVWAAQSEYTFTAELPRFHAVVASKDRDDVAPFAISVQRKEGTIVVDTDSAQIVDGELSDALANLYYAIKVKVYRLGEVANELLADLGTLGAEDEPF